MNIWKYKPNIKKKEILIEIDILFERHLVHKILMRYDELLHFYKFHQLFFFYFVFNFCFCLSKNYRKYKSLGNCYKNVYKKLVFLEWCINKEQLGN